MKKVLTLATVALLAGSLAAGCSKHDTTTDPNATVNGTVTDSGSTGLKETAQTAKTTGDVAHGGQIFAQNCASCHGANGAGGGIGPVLKGEKAKKNMDAAVAWIKNPAAPMPKLYPAPLSDRDVTDVATYVESL